jgi:hypothetical protein
MANREKEESKTGAAPNTRERITSLQAVMLFLKQCDGANRRKALRREPELGEE